MALVQLRSCLEKGAKDCGAADSVPEINRRLLNMYGMSPTEAREHLHTIQRRVGEKYTSLGNRVEKLTKLAYGGVDPEMEGQLAMENFQRAIDDPALRRHLLVVQARTLDQAVMAAEQYELVGRQPSRPPRARDVHRVANVEDNSCMNVVDHQKSSDGKMDEYMKSIVTKLDQQAVLLQQQADRISSLENTPKNSYKPGKLSEVRRCFSCGDPSHFRRDCPKRKTFRGGDQPATKARDQENH